jgi:hypothetical protein
MGKKADDLRATAEDLIADADRLKRIEERKLELEATDPEVDRLSQAGEQVAEEMRAKARLQRQMASDQD